MTKYEALKVLEKAVSACERAGFTLVANSDIGGIAVMTKEEYDAFPDLREYQEDIVDLKYACGGNSSMGSKSDVAG